MEGEAPMDDGGQVTEWLATLGLDEPLEEVAEAPAPAAAGGPLVVYDPTKICLPPVLSVDIGKPLDPAAFGIEPTIRLGGMDASPGDLARWNAGAQRGDKMCIDNLTGYYQGLASEGGNYSIWAIARQVGAKMNQELASDFRSYFGERQDYFIRPLNSPPIPGYAEGYIRRTMKDLDGIEKELQTLIDQTPPLDLSREQQVRHTLSSVSGDVLLDLLSPGDSRFAEFVKYLDMSMMHCDGKDLKSGGGMGFIAYFQRYHQVSGLVLKLATARLRLAKLIFNGKDIIERVKNCGKILLSQGKLNIRKPRI